MISFFKKYWINILLFVILTILIFFFIPNQESLYLKPEADTKKKFRLVLLWTELLLSVMVLYFVGRNSRKISEFLCSTGALGLIALGFFFFLDSIFLSAAFLINKLSTKQTINITYSVVYIDSARRNLLLWDNSLNKSVQADNLLTQDYTNISLKVRDTVIVSFSKGLLGFNFDPRMKSR